MMVVMMMSQTDSRGYSFFREYINVVRCGNCTHEFQNQRFGTNRNNTQYGRLLLYNDPPLTVACVFFTTNQNTRSLWQATQHHVHVRHAEWRHKYLYIWRVSEVTVLLASRRWLFFV